MCINWKRKMNKKIEYKKHTNTLHYIASHRTAIATYRFPCASCLLALSLPLSQSLCKHDTIFIVQKHQINNTMLMHADNIFYVNKRFSKQSMWLCWTLMTLIIIHCTRDFSLSLFSFTFSCCPNPSLVQTRQWVFDSALLPVQWVNALNDGVDKDVNTHHIAKNMDTKTSAPLVNFDRFLVSFVPYRSFLPLIPCELLFFFFILRLLFCRVYITVCLCLCFMFWTRYPLQASAINFAAISSNNCSVYINKWHKRI